MNVAILVLTWNAADAANACLASLAQQERAPETILVVDNGSQDDTVARIRQHHPDVLLHCNDHNLGFSAGMNVGIQTLQALQNPPDIVVLLNQDVTLAPTWLAHMIAPFATDPMIGATGCKICYPDGTIQHAGAYLAYPRAVTHHIGSHEPDEGQHDHSRPYELVTGAVMAIQMHALQQIGLFDTGYTPAYYEDTDLCWRLRRQHYQIMYVASAIATHHESFSIRNPLVRSGYYNRGRLRFVLKSYELPDILGAFAESEHAFIQEHGHTSEERALRWAYMETLRTLPGLWQARNALHAPLSDAERAHVTAMLLSLKNAIKTSCYQRAYALIDAFYTV